MKTLKEEIETKVFSDKELFDDFKDSIGGRCFNKDSVYRWVYKLTDIKPTTEEVYKIMDGWVKSKWAYKKENEKTGADFYYFDLKETVNERRKNMKRKVKSESKLLKEEEYYGDDKYANVNIVNKDPNSTPYMLYIWCGRGYMLDRFLCFADYEEDAIDTTLEWLWDKGNYDMVYDYDKVRAWAQEFAIDDDEEMQDMKERMEELEKVYDKYQDNIGDTIDNNWSDYRNIEKEYDSIKDEYEEMSNEKIDNYISEEFVNDSNYQLFVNSAHFKIEELDMDTAKEVIYQSEYVIYGQDVPTFEEVEGTLFNESKRIMKEENKNLKFVKSFKVLKIPFSEIGYFGKSNWQYAMTFAENNKKGWRLPNEDESILISEHFEDAAKELVWDTDFYFWTNEEDDDTHAISSYVGATDVTPIHLSLKDDINYVFLIR